MAELSGRNSEWNRCSHLHYRKKSMGRNTHCCRGESALSQYSSFETFWHISFTQFAVIWYLGDDMRAHWWPIYMYVLVSYQIIQSCSVYQNVAQSNTYNGENNSCFSILTTGHKFPSIAWQNIRDENLNSRVKISTSRVEQKSWTPLLLSQTIEFCTG